MQRQLQTECEATLQLAKSKRLHRQTASIPFKEVVEKLDDKCM